MGLRKSVLHQVKKRLPAPVKDRLLDARKWARRKKWEQTVAGREDLHFDRDLLAHHLRDLGITHGQDLFVHSSMSRMGKIEGGADAIIDALRDAAGPDATILMPVYPISTSMFDHMSVPKPFTVADDRSTMGKITRVFRARDGVLRSGHPTHSVAAQGPRAALYTSRHHLSGSPCGEGSPFRLLSQNGGAVVCIGSGLGKVTSHHTIEDLYDGFPVDVYLPEPMTKEVRFPDGHSEMVSVRVHDPELSAIRIDNHAETEAAFARDFTAAGLVKAGKVGNADTHLFDAHALDEFHRGRIPSGLTIYARG